jgi:hypothetical protein
VLGVVDGQVKAEEREMRVWEQMSLCRSAPRLYGTLPGSWKWTVINQ